MSFLQSLPLLVPLASGLFHFLFSAGSLGKRDFLAGDWQLSSSSPLHASSKFGRAAAFSVSFLTLLDVSTSGSAAGASCCSPAGCQSHVRYNTRENERLTIKAEEAYYHRVYEQGKIDGELKIRLRKLLTALLHMVCV